MEDAFAVDHDDVLLLHARGYEYSCDGDVRCSCTNHGDQCGVQWFSHDFQGVDCSCGDDGCGSLLVVMPDRDVHFFSKSVEDVEAFWFFDVFEVDASEAWLEPFDCLDDLLRVFGVKAEGVRIHAAEVFEQE